LRSSSSNIRAVAFLYIRNEWTREKIRRKCLTLLSLSLYIHVHLVLLFFWDNNNNHHHQRRRTTMRSPTLNNNHPSPHDINTNKQPQQTNGNGVK
jgi:hypothetical protein